MQTSQQSSPVIIWHHKHVTPLALHKRHLTGETKVDYLSAAIWQEGVVGK